jgi:thioredoxin-like negative regulator of GroEL
MDVDDLKKEISNAPGILVYFKNDKCAPCMVLRPKVEELVANEFPALKFVVVDTMESPLLSGTFNVFANPTILVFFEGKEYIRKSKYIGISELGQEIQRIYSMVF